jgi:tRNA dimethylallyltransferase
MSIGTAKPDESELAAVKHYFINSHSISESFSVGDFEKQGLAILDELFKTHDKVILAGGSGLYIKAICEGFDDLPVADVSVREKLNQQLEDEGIATLQEKLKQVDPDYYAEVDLNNPQRIIRALEVFETSGKAFSSYRNATINKRRFNIIKLALDMPREKLYERINLRVDIMVKQGLVEEAKSLLPHRELNALNTVGYSELFDHFDGKISLDEALLLIKQNTRRFAKRQLTWFRKGKDFIWFDAGAPDVIAQMIKTVEATV